MIHNMIQPMSIVANQQAQPSRGMKRTLSRGLHCGSYTDLLNQGLDYVGDEGAPMLFDESLFGHFLDNNETALMGLASPAPHVQSRPKPPVTKLALVKKIFSKKSVDAPRVSIKPLRPMTAEEHSAFLAFLVQAPINNRSMNVHGQITTHVLPTTGQTINCVLWEGRHYISSYDILKALQLLVLDEGQGSLCAIDVDSKKFEENVFSVLRHFKVGVNCHLEEAKSELIQWLHQNGCIRTQKKQKVYYWSDVNLTTLACEVRSMFFRPAEDGASKKRKLDDQTPQPFIFDPKLNQVLNPLAPMFPSNTDQRLETIPSLLGTQVSGPFAPMFFPDAERKHFCPFCGTGFKRQEHLRRHERIHTGEKRYSCLDCDKHFARSDNLKQHVRQCHAEQEVVRRIHA